MMQFFDELKQKEEKRTIVEFQVFFVNRVFMLCLIIIRVLKEPAVAMVTSTGKYDFCL